MEAHDETPSTLENATSTDAANSTALVDSNESLAVDTASQPYVGRWQRLISTTNWEKGRIICQWRETVSAEGRLAAEYSDESWARLVGGVTPQHVGRLRRV